MLLISAVQQGDSVIHTYTYIYILFHVLYHGLSQDIDYSSLCSTVCPQVSESFTSFEDFQRKEGATFGLPFQGSVARVP